MRRDVPPALRHEAVRSVLAYAVVGGGLLLLGLAWIVRGPDAERLAAALAGLIGLVLGYYFGTRTA